MLLKRIISSGQAGVERAALDSAIRMLIYSWGGWVPRGRLAEDGELPERYFESERIDSGLTECPRGRPGMARSRNIRDSDATLILRPSKLKKLPESLKIVIETCTDLDKPYKITDPTKIARALSVARWICESHDKEASDENEYPIETLNVVGYKESKCPGIYDRTFIFINDVLSIVSTNDSWGIKMWAPAKRIKPKE